MKKNEVAAIALTLGLAGLSASPAFAAFSGPVADGGGVLAMADSLVDWVRANIFPVIVVFLIFAAAAACIAGDLRRGAMSFIIVLVVGAFAASSPTWWPWIKAGFA